MILKLKIRLPHSVRVMRFVAISWQVWDDLIGIFLSLIQVVSLTLRSTYLKSVNLQYNTLVCWADGTNDSSTKRLMFQVSFFFHKILQNSLQKPFQFFFFFLIKLQKLNKEICVHWNDVNLQIFIICISTFLYSTDECILVTVSIPNRFIKWQ